MAKCNPWGKTKKEQLQLWNNLSFNLQKTDIDEQIDLVLTLGNMLQQDKHSKIEEFIETMSTIYRHIQLLNPIGQRSLRRQRIGNIL